jgi:hypothetical protein
VELQTSQTPTPHTWADMGLADESVDLYCLAGVAGSAVPLQPAAEVELADFQRLVKAAGWAGSQRFAGEAELAGSTMVAAFLVGQSWTLQSPSNIPEGVLD